MNAPAQRVSAPLIRTKLCAPQLRQGLVARPYLVRRLGESSSHTLTLVCAPAGYGKTTLLATWLAELKKTITTDKPIVCWLSLDEEDNEPIRFLNYLVASIEASGIGIAIEARTMVQAIPPPPLPTMLAVFINDLEKLAHPIYLVLDDYQFISNTAIHDGLAYLLDHWPSNAHLVIATRSDPAFPLARLRARGQLREIRVDDLRFSHEEATHLFHQVMALDLTANDLTHLEERTEGWIAGLQMAALALKSISQTKQADTSTFVENFAGSNRYILDYLVEEVLSRQPKEVLGFLLQTSILENLCGPLCDAVTEIHNSQDILEYLERANLFVVSLDTERLWYRYHHLFADLLRARMAQREPQMAAELYLRASNWYEQNQLFPEAINQALNAKDFDRACKLIEMIVEQIFAQNHIGMLLGWIKRLPRETALERPWLCIAQAWSAMFYNEVENIEPLLQTAEQSIQTTDRADLQKAWRGHIACLRAFTADVNNDVPHTIERAQEALENLRPEDTANRTFAKYMLGRAYFLRGEFPQAAATFAENVRDCMAANATNIIAPSLSMLSKVHRIEGKPRDSIACIHAGQAYIEQCDPKRVTVAGLAYVGQANVLREWNDLEAAEKLSRRSLELCEPWHSPSAICVCQCVLAHILLEQGKFPAVEEALQQAEDSIRGRGPLADVACDLHTMQAGFWLATGQLSKASQWAQEWEENYPPKDEFSISTERNEITLARIRIAEGNPKFALQTLESLAPSAESGGRMGHLLEIRILQALAHQALGDPKQALEMLNKSFVLAEGEEYIRIFLDEGKPMQDLLLAYAHWPSKAHSGYTNKLLTAYGTQTIEGSVETKPSNLVEPLTVRETDVLRLVAEGYSNHQIAEKLVLAEGTVKFYVHAVLEKLGVHNRTQAVIEAKKEKII